MGAAVQVSFSLKSPVGVTLVTVNGPAPELVSTTLEVALGVLRSCPAKVRDVVDRFTAGCNATPVPDRWNVKGLFSALEVMVRVPLLVPAAVGLKVTLSEHAGPFSGSGEVQVGGSTWKSPEALAVMLVIPLTPVAFVYCAASEMVCGAVGVLIGEEPKSGRDAGVALSCGVTRLK